MPSTTRLSVSSQRKSVVLLPDVTTTDAGLVLRVALADTTRLLADRGESSLGSTLVHGVTDPVDSWVSTDGLVGWVNHDDFEELVGCVLVDPVRVENSQVAASSRNSLLGGGSEGSLVLQVVDTHVGGFTEGSTLWRRLLSSTSSDTDSIDDVSLLGLVSQSSGLVWSRWSRSSVHNGELSVFPTSDSEEESKDIALLFLVKLLEILVGTHIKRLKYYCML